MKRLLVLLVFLLTINSVLAQLSTGETPSAVTGWLGTLGSYTLLLWVIGGAFIFIGFLILKPLKRIRELKWFCFIGLIIIFFATFGVEIAYLMPYLGKPVVTFTVCQSLFGSSTDVITSIAVGSACVFSGFAPSDLAPLTIITFFIFGVFAPLGVLMAMFYEFTDFLTNPTVRYVMTFLSALIAFRFLLASMFTELLGYGFAGLGLLAVNYFFFMVLLSMMKKLWVGYEAVERVVAEEDREILANLIRRRDDLQNTMSHTDKKKNQQMYAAYQNDLNAINDQIKEYMKRNNLPKV